MNTNSFLSHRECNKKASRELACSVRLVSYSAVGAANTACLAQIAKLSPPNIKMRNILILNNGLYFADAWSNLLSARERECASVVARRRRTHLKKISSAAAGGLQRSAQCGI